MKFTRRNCSIAAMPFLFGLLILGGYAMPTKRTDPLQSFYIVTHYFSDSLADSYEEILDVAPQGNDVRVRLIRISSATRYCGGSLVRAAEHNSPHTTLSAVARGVNLCSFTAEKVDAALAAAKPKTAASIEDSATLSIVAKCGADEKVFEFPYPVLFDVKILDRDHRDVLGLFYLNYKVRERVFGMRSPLPDLLPAQERESDDRGTQLLPELLSGKYNAGFEPNYLAGLLKGYTGPPAKRDPASVELLNATSLHLEKYVLPQFPRIAEVAHVLGDVNLSIVPDPQTGLVKDVDLLSGPRLLGEPSVKAAKNWQFTPGSQSAHAVQVTLRFTLCPNDQK